MHLNRESLIFLIENSCDLVNGPSPVGWLALYGLTMAIFAFKVLLSSLIISFCSFLANKKPELAGFIVAMPLTTMLVLLFSYGEFQNSEKAVAFAKSIFVGVPLSLLFFIPFLFADRFNLGFIQCYVGGFMLLVFGYFTHGWIMARM